MRNIFVLGITCALTFSLAADTLSAASYAQDGLVGQWDGLENAGAGLHDGTTNYWTDLTGQTGDFALFTGIASFTADGLKKNAQGIMATNVTPTARSDVRTIEVVVSGAPASGWVNALLITESQTVTFNNDRGGYRECFFDFQKYGWQTTQKPARLVGRWDGIENAGEGIHNTATNRWVDLSGQGGDWTTSGYTIHAIRLYDRVLSDAEIKRHATIDQIRFFGAPADIMPSSSKRALVATAGTGGVVAVDDVNASPDAKSKMEIEFAHDVFPAALRAIPLPGWKFTGWTGDFSCVIEGSTSTPVIVVSFSCGRVYQATFERDPDNVAPAARRPLGRD